MTLIAEVRPEDTNNAAASKQKSDEDPGNLCYDQGELALEQMSGLIGRINGIGTRSVEAESPLQICQGTNNTINSKGDICWSVPRPFLGEYGPKELFRVTTRKPKPSHNQKNETGDRGLERREISKGNKRQKRGKTNGVNLRCKEGSWFPPRGGEKGGES